jgi:hypothetical protein
MYVCLNVYEFETTHLRMHMRRYISMYVYTEVYVYECTLVCFRISMCGRLSGISCTSKDGRFYFDLYEVIGPSSVLAK